MLRRNEELKSMVIDILIKHVGYDFNEEKVAEEIVTKILEVLQRDSK